MLKLLCVFSVYFAVIYALEKKAEITWGRVYKGKDYEGVTITTNGNKTEITWKQPTNETKNILRALFTLKIGRKKNIKYVDLENLCHNVKKGSLEDNVKKFALKTIANLDDCPITKGAKATFEVPSTYSYTSDSNECGPYQSQLNIFITKGQSSGIPIITGLFRGNITGCK